MLSNLKSVGINTVFMAISCLNELNYYLYKFSAMLLQRNKSEIRMRLECTPF